MSFSKLVHFIQVIKVVGIELFTILLNYPFNAHGICSNIPSFLSVISNLPLLSFFLSWPGYRLIDFIDLFQKPVLCFVDFLYQFLFFNVLIFVLIFIIYFLLFTSELICSSFSSFLRWKFRLMILQLSSFPIYAFHVIFSL